MASRYSAAVVLRASLVALALAAPTPSKPTTPTTAGPKPVDQAAVGDCEPPSASQCLTPGYVESLCGRLNRATCAPVVIARLKTFHEAVVAPVVKMLRPGRHELPVDLRGGKYFPYKGPKTPFVRAGSHPLARAGLDGLSIDRLGRVDAATAAQAHRNPAWAANGQAVTSCAEFAYEKVHDLARFIDAAAACRGDRSCVLDVAFLPQAPGIAERTLVRSDGQPLPAWNQFPVYRGVLPKNDMFAAGASFVRSRGANPLPATPELSALEAALTTGNMYYRTDCVGNQCDDRKFADEWKWHRAMRQRTAKVSEAEFEEYERRRAEFRALMASWNAAVQKELNAIPEEAARVLPYDMRTVDPLARLDIARGFVREAQIQEQKFRKSATPQQLKKALGEAGGQGAVGGQGALQRGAVTGVLAMPAPTQKPETQPQAQAQPEVNPCLLQQQWGSELMRRGPVSCAIGQFLRVEWQRKLAGHKSCLDLGSADCDWSPAMFSARFVEQVPGIQWQTAHEQLCTAWTGGTLSNKHNLKEVEDFIALMQKKVAEARKALTPYAKPDGKSFGAGWDEHEREGDRDWFAAEYKYGLGWEVQGTKTSQADGRVCELGGRFWAGGSFNAYMLGSDPIAVVDARLGGSVNKSGNHKGLLSSHLRVLGQDLYAPLANETVIGVFEEEAAAYGTQLPPGPPIARPSFTVMAGPVPITGAAWGELLYGTSLRFGAKAPSGCNSADPSFGLNAAFVPFFAANARAQVGVGITGIVSAGIRGTLNLLTIGLPFTVNLQQRLKQVSGESLPHLDFDLDLALELASLAGRMSLYLEFLLYEEEWELFRWRGVGPASVDLMPKLTVSMPLLGMQ